MAWYALYKWSVPWQKTSCFNWIRWYRKYLYDKWFDNLSEEKKQKELCRIEQIKQKQEEDGEQVFANLSRLLMTMNNCSHGRILDYMEMALEKK